MTRTFTETYFMPAGPSETSVYSVEVRGDTLVLPFTATMPTPLIKAVSPVVVQVSVADSPGSTASGLAVIRASSCAQPAAVRRRIDISAKDFRGIDCFRGENSMKRQGVLAGINAICF